MLAQRVDWPAPPIVTRAQWGANERLRKPRPDLQLVGGEDHRAPHRDAERHHRLRRLARGIFTNELNNGYIDIAYNWLIDPLGRIYEGRWAQNYPAGAPHTGERKLHNVQGAHALVLQRRHDRHRADGRLHRCRAERGDDRVAPHADDVEMRALGDRPARRGRRTSTPKATRVTGLANICGHRDTYATACPGATVEAMLPNLRAQVAARVAVGATGYWIASSAGQLLAFGNLPNDGGLSSARLDGARSSGSAAHPSGRGYWLFAEDGGVFTFGDAQLLRLDRRHAPQPADGRDGADADRERLLARRPRRRRVLLRRRAVLRLHRRDAAELAGARAHADADRQGLLALRARRRHLQLRRRAASSARPAACG